RIIDRMKKEGERSQEYAMLYDYVDFIVGLPWKKQQFQKIDLASAQEILDSDHYGLKKIKKRIIQQIAVLDLKKSQSGSILCFVGAPGTGKTSIGRSIAKALGREYVRVSLGGVRDEADIRGHRRTYVGAMPGRIMDGISKAGVSNPVMVLDEIDKLSESYHGDPAAALLEVLDPEQNSSFTDHYMNVPYDLSDVLFICTANTVDSIPEPLLNRMEVISFPGYTETEKYHIAVDHLLKKAEENAGIEPGHIHIPEDTMHSIISDYTMEAGVRGLKRQLDTLCRTAAVRLVEGNSDEITIGKDELREFLDRRPLRHEITPENSQPGVVTGLAWTQAGGDILYIETLFTKGTGKVTVTGQLGDVMKESVQIAVSLVKSMFPDKADMFDSNDLHIHVPDGAVPKDGPSAGITLTTALSSLVTGHTVSPKLAMTGEVSLRGVVSPIGGLPEKLMAAKRAGVSKVFIPAENEQDLEDVADEVKGSLTIIPVTTVKDVLTHAQIL
ncbi:MAG: endopeptidase La, partial [Oscillospiraceae bacterium]|nr:endopeptidase La [Oscillospiraceae bacterium]